MLCVKITILSQATRTEGWLPDLGDGRLASDLEIRTPTFLARAVIDPYLLQIIHQSRAGHRLTFRNTWPVCKLQPVYVMQSTLLVSFHYLSSRSIKAKKKKKKRKIQEKSKRQEKIKLIEGKNLIF